MSTNLVIVAIPEENDRVWKISSEKVPHLTLLFLGATESNPHLAQIMQFVEHAVTLCEHGPFYLDVDHRGTLGEDEADVLFFSRRSWNLKWIKQFRGQLLQNQQIRSAYDSTEQFPEWNPHLTLGYPETPAKQLEDNGFDHPLYSVAFDRIAVWTGDFDGPEFRLEWPEREMEGDLAIAYSDTQKAALLHYGAKGAKWGRRTSAPGETTKVDDNGCITGLEQIEDTMSQTTEHGEVFVDGLVHGPMDLGEAFLLEHYGIKGMRWGQRNAGTVGLAGGSTGRGAGTVGLAGGSTGRAGGKRPPPKAVAPQATSKVPHGSRRKTKIETEGGENHPASSDAIKVAESRSKLKRSGPKALSNQELREVAQRAQLEQQAVQATRSGSGKFIRRLLGQHGQQVVNETIREGVKEGRSQVRDHLKK